MLGPRSLASHLMEWRSLNHSIIFLYPNASCHDGLRFLRLMRLLTTGS